MSNIPLETSESSAQRTETARQMAEQVRAIVETLPGFVFITKQESRRLAVAASVPDRFLEAAAGAMDQSPALASSAKMSATDLRSSIIEAQAYLGLADELERLARGVRDTAKVGKGAVGTEALRVYSVARHLNRARDSESSVSSLDQMQRTLNRGRLRSRPIVRQPDTPASAVVPQTGDAQ